MMWTIIPPEVVWEGIEEKPKDLLQLEWLGVQMLVEPLQFAQGKIVRLLSSEPNDFLRPELQPGSIIDLIPHA
ncbi:MAG: hypothetical protein GX354_03930 [Firmicutes bacterium]|nr:hypothetical protein [Bacillota bacterium]